MLTGFVGGPAARDDWNKLDVPGLRGIVTTAPYFHNNSAATLVEVVDHYVQFFNRVKANDAIPAPMATPTVGISTGSRPPKSAHLCWRICGSSRRGGRQSLGPDVGDRCSGGAPRVILRACSSA